jgi:hypothetical protein
MINWTDLSVNPELMEKIRLEFAKGGSDKINHYYERIYQYFFSRVTPSSLLEIGLANYAPLLGTHGANSLFIWPRLFPNCTVYGGDLQDDRLFNSTRADHPGPTVPSDLDQSKLNAFQVDQSSEASLIEFSKKLGDVKFDMIIDDASHRFEHSRRTFEILLPKLSDTGFYLIEDNCPVPIGTQQTVADWESYLKDKPTLKSKVINAWPGSNTDSIIVAIWKI